ncbi:MAG: polyamine ABC transporter substrate-binding protein [Lysobacteraceae bacterium]|jgi:putrescine transport system substrate-binding protein|nr:polyamine ABC transporter substrate-binding protein [Xanthomonadaceae bacterium]MCZ8318196.1 polyamine ABC transporter substrate-binding protein [Silanimonas sp.]
MRLILTALAASIALAACGGNADAPAADGAKPDGAAKRQVNVYNWSDYIAPDTIERFTKETGIEVVYDVYADNETLDAKLVAGQSGYDVIFPSAPFAQQHIANGLYATLDRTQLANIGNLDPSLAEGVAVADPEGTHLVPYMWGTTAIGYNVAKVREILGADTPLDSWALVFDPAISGKLAACGIAILDDQQEGFSAALLFHGRDPNGMGSGEIELVQQTFAAVRPNIRYFNSSRYIDDLANGEICVAMGYNGDVLQARARAEEAGTGVEIGYLIPKEGAIRWFDAMAIPADAPNKAEAHAFIDFLLRPDVIAPISEFVNYASANAAAKPLVAEALRNDPAVYPPEDVIAKLHDARKLPLEENDARQRAWTTIKSGK